ncbi:hypothetical protein ACRS34_21195, partial [Stutzerimonas stutzeri]|uniref:hypothetical protein n=2 Tax=Stutzerimonas stutzeri TaxID=316 RepID=UPI003EE416F1
AMIDPADQQTQALPLDEQPAKRKRGRPATGKAMTPAEKQRAYRERQLLKARDNLTLELRAALSSLLGRILTVRLTDFRADSGRNEFLRVQGYLAALQDLGVITWDQLCMLTDLLLNASQHAGKPFPCELNAGPVMPVVVAYKRRYAHNGGQVKPSA